MIKAVLQCIQESGYCERDNVKIIERTSSFHPFEESGGWQELPLVLRMNFLSCIKGHQRKQSWL